MDSAAIRIAENPSKDIPIANDGTIFLPTFTYIYHNKIQSNATIHAGKYTNPNGIVRIFPLFNNEPLRPTSCSTLPGEGGIFCP